MNYEYDGLTINYRIEGKGQPIILLHGWGTNMDTFNNIAKELSSKYEVHQIDLIGFGLTSLPNKSLNVDDYVIFLEDYIKRFKIIKPIILGHSFGGRIAIKYASKTNNLLKLILVDSAGIKKRSTLIKKIKVINFKCKKKWYRLTKNVMAYNKLIRKVGSYDYQMAPDVMKGTLGKVIKEDLTKYLKQVNCETLIIWGRDDKETPYSDALKMHKLIKNSGLVTFDNIGHFPYLENKNYFNKVLKTYLEVKD